MQLLALVGQNESPATTACMVGLALGSNLNGLRNIFGVRRFRATHPRKLFANLLLQHQKGTCEPEEVRKIKTPTHARKLVENSRDFPRWCPCGQQVQETRSDLLHNANFSYLQAGRVHGGALDGATAGKVQPLTVAAAAATGQHRLGRDVEPSFLRSVNCYGVA
eukprot:gene12084-biopygen21451